MMDTPRVIRRLVDAWEIAERTALGLLAGGIVVISALQIILRNFFGTGLRWAEPFLGMSLLWLTMLGALAATGMGKHITIDLVSHFIPGRAKRFIFAANSLFAAVACGFLAWASWRFVGFQKEMGSVALLGVPAFKLYMVMPVVFWIMTFRFALHAVLNTARGIAGNGERAP